MPNSMFGWRTSAKILVPQSEMPCDGCPITQYYKGVPNLKFDPQYFRIALQFSPTVSRYRNLCTQYPCWCGPKTSVSMILVLTT